MINFINGHIKYVNALTAIINPIIKYLPENSWNITQNDIDGDFNISFFHENYPHKDLLYVHGMADKKYRLNQNIKDFKYIHITGSLWKEKLINQGVNPNKLIMIGFSKLDPIFNGDVIKTPYNKTTILFAPTHDTCNDVSIQHKYQSLLNIIPDKYHILQSHHPATKNDKMPTLQLLADADIVISDCSSIVYEALSLGKQVIFLDWLVKNNILRIYNNTFDAELYLQQLGLHATNENHFLQLLEYASQHELDNKTKNFIDGIFSPDLRGNSGIVAAKFLLKKLEEEYS